MKITRLLGVLVLFLMARIAKSHYMLVQIGKDGSTNRLSQSILGESKNGRL